MGVPAKWQKKGSAWLSLVLLVATVSFRAEGGRGVRLSGHFPRKKIQGASHLGRFDARSAMTLAVVMKPHDEAGLEDFAKRVSDPSDVLYQQFLTPAEYKDRFAPTDAEVSQVVASLSAQGLTISKVHDNNLVIDVTGPVASIEKAFQLEMHQYRTADGRKVIAPSDDPLVDEAIAPHLQSITGLDSFRVWRKHTARKHTLDPHSGISSYMTPAKINSAYSFGTNNTGSGETLALFELDGYSASDISAYTSYFSLTAPTLTKVLVDGASGSAGSNTDEVCLDIELAMAVSPGLSAIKVFEGPNSDQGVLDTYNAIASDGTVNEMSTSWGSAEDTDTASFTNSEHTIFSTMASEGMSAFAAAGDSGAFDDTSNPSALQVDDPGSQLYVTSVGGTTLTLSGTSWSSETSWGISADAEGGGGGVSALWTLPSWQSGLASLTNKGSRGYRMVPDVSLDANPNTGYAIYTEGGWYAIGGTSAAAPIWAAYIAQVNSARRTSALTRLGFINPSLYQVAQSTAYSSTFHDVSDGSNNLYFTAVTGFDLSTGLGTPQGSALLSVLAASSLPPAAPGSVTTSGSGGNSAVVSWASVSGATSYTVYRSSTFSGAYTNLGSTAATSYTDGTAGATNAYYYYVVANNGSGYTSGASSKRAGAANLAKPSTASGLSSTEAP